VAGILLTEALRHDDEEQREETVEVELVDAEAFVESDVRDEPNSLDEVGDELDAGLECLLLKEVLE